MIKALRQCTLGAILLYPLLCGAGANAESTVLAGGASSSLPSDLTEIGLEKLLNLDLVVTLPSQKEQKVRDVASAVYVLTGDDVRKSGATSIAEALRMVPGINVARISSRQWAISLRGFNQEFSNKLLVLLDGRSILSPFFNGVYWQLQDNLDIAKVRTAFRFLY